MFIFYFLETINFQGILFFENINILHCETIPEISAIIGSKKDNDIGCIYLSDFYKEDHLGLYTLNDNAEQKMIHNYSNSAKKHENKFYLPKNLKENRPYFFKLKSKGQEYYSDAFVKNNKDWEFAALSEDNSHNEENGGKRKKQKSNLPKGLQKKLNEMMSSKNKQKNEKEEKSEEKNESSDDSHWVLWMCFGILAFIVLCLIIGLCISR